MIGLAERLERLLALALLEVERAAQAMRPRITRSEPDRFIDVGVCLGPSLGVGILACLEEPLDHVPGDPVGGQIVEHRDRGREGSVERCQTRGSANAWRASAKRRATASAAPLSYAASGSNVVVCDAPVFDPAGELSGGTGGGAVAPCGDARDGAVLGGRAGFAAPTRGPQRGGQRQNDSVPASTAHHPPPCRWLDKCRRRLFQGDAAAADGRALRRARTEPSLRHLWPNSLTAPATPGSLSNVKVSHSAKTSRSGVTPAFQSAWELIGTNCSCAIHACEPSGEL